MYQSPYKGFNSRDIISMLTDVTYVYQSPYKGFNRRWSRVMATAIGAGINPPIRGSIGTDSLILMTGGL